MEKILVCGVPNSDNLGDRIIAETLKHLIINSSEDVEITNFDFTNGFVNNTHEKKNEEIALISKSKVKKLIPNPLRRIKVWAYYRNNKKLENDLKIAVSKSDKIIIGGGHLLIDNYLNFPIGINNVVQMAKKYNKPVIFAFVGAKGPWSKTARNYFANALNYSKSIAVRDQVSKDFLTSVDVTCEKKISVLSDPALFTKELLNTDSSNNKSSYQIGLGIMDPKEIERHSDLRWSREVCADWWISVINLFTAKGIKVNIFTNGAKTDNAFVEYFIKGKFSRENDKVNFYSYPKEYNELLNIISLQDMIIAQRLHACLPSISLEKPTYGLMWDVKLISIFNDLGMNEYVIDFNEEPITTVNKVLNNISLKDRNFNMELVNQKKLEMVSFVNE